MCVHALLPSLAHRVFGSSAVQPIEAMVRPKIPGAAQHGIVPLRMCSKINVQQVLICAARAKKSVLGAHGAGK